MEKAEDLGGEEICSRDEYTRRDTVPYCDKGGHKERSIFHQPNHEKHWKKVEREKIEREP